MTKVLFVDASAGASGDMILGALVDLGVPLERIRKAVSGLGARGIRLSAGRVERSGLAARKVSVRVADTHSERDWHDIRRLLSRNRLEPAIRERALRIFRRLFEAEGRAHGAPADRVHLHEAGALDAIADVVGACVGLAWLDPARIVVSPLTTGSGTVECRHGTYPVPGPATLFLLEGAPVSGIEASGERLTPTGAAILTTVADGWGGPPQGRVLRVGHGAGDHDFPDRPNVLRMVLLEAADAPKSSASGGAEVVVLEFTVDDETPQRLAYACERLLEAGALDVFTTPVHMKKGRSGHNVTVTARRAQLEPLARIVFEETSTLGLRYRIEGRIELARSVASVKTRYGPVRVKTGAADGIPERVWPEYEDCAEIARRRGIPLRDVQHEAIRAREAKPAKRARAKKKRRA
jgi:uncharacterized protein (TIGR00299 family) protein